MSLWGRSPLTDRDESAAKPGSRKRRWAGGLICACAGGGGVCVSVVAFRWFAFSYLTRGGYLQRSTRLAFPLPRCLSFPEGLLSPAPSVRASTVSARARTTCPASGILAPNSRGKKDRALPKLRPFLYRARHRRQGSRIEMVSVIRECSDVDETGTWDRSCLFST